MSKSEVKAYSVICGCCGGSADCHCRLQTLVRLRNSSYEGFSSVTSSKSDLDFASAGNFSLTDSAVPSAYCRFCGQSSDFSRQTNASEHRTAATLSTRRLCISGENFSNFTEFDSDTNAAMNIRQSSDSTHSLQSVELINPAEYQNTGAPLMTLEFGLPNSIQATVLVTSPVEATHCVRSCSPCAGRAVNQEQSVESDSDSWLDRMANDIPVEMEVAGLYDGDYNSAESQGRLERKYLKSLKPAVELHRTIADPLPELIDMRQVRQNFKLVKLRQHPMQVAAESRRQEDIGINRLDQILHQRKIMFHKHLLNQDGGRNSELLASNNAAYPDWMTFKLRMMKNFASIRWRLFVAQRSQLRSSEPKNVEKRANIRECHKYNPKYIDIWSTMVTVSVKDGSLLRDALSAAFARLGLDKRTDFRFTVGCFLGDKRQIGRNGRRVAPIEVFESTPVRDLYHMNASEIFLNDNKLKLFNELPESVHGYPGWGKDFMKEEPEEPEIPEVKKKSCCCR